VTPDTQKTPWYWPENDTIRGAIVLVGAILLIAGLADMFPRTAERIGMIAERISTAATAENLDNWLSSLGKEK
jgi:hypothetical protein